MLAKEFQELILNFYSEHKRILPWRWETDPYKIFVSEVMLQQTQVSRVLVKYPEFIRYFPTFRSLAQASLRDVLSVWQGMGYNRRGKYLKDSAEIIVSNKQYDFMFCRSEKKTNKMSGSNVQPRTSRGILHSAWNDREEVKRLVMLLQDLPGIGHATASAIVTYSFNLPTVFIETNIRSVYLYYYYKNETNISDKELAEKVNKTLDYDNPRDWYYGLTDYGAMLKKKKKFANIQSKHYTKQSKFEGSRRQIRGAIIRTLLKNKKTKQQLISETGANIEIVSQVLLDLTKEKIVALNNSYYTVR